MTTQPVQLAGGDATQVDAYTGPARELQVDTTNMELRLQDGVTPGGSRIISRDASDQRYQFKSDELDGFTSLLPEQRGFMARLGPGNYRLRKLTVNLSQMVIANPEGYAGDPLLGFADTITTEHTWTGQHLFTNVCQFDAGINADVSGDTTGLHTGNVVGNLTGNATGDHVGTFVGDVDVSTGTIIFADEQIPLSALSGLLPFILDSAFPSGGIIDWSGSVALIPDGWVLCDGANSTPDLRDRFIVGAGGAYAPGASGGSLTHSHTATTAAAGVHAHPITVDGHTLTESEMPAHKHGSGVLDVAAVAFNHGSFTASPSSGSSITTNSADGTVEGWSTDSGGGTAHSHTGASTDAGSHTHVATVDAATAIPPYYALCKIMKV